jgi:hypothetical protein
LRQCKKTNDGVSGHLKAECEKVAKEASEKTTKEAAIEASQGQETANCLNLENIKHSFK